jgi:hypothetical protein
MSKESTKIIPWEKTVAEIEDVSGIPRKQIDEVATQIGAGIESIIKNNQPKRDGDKVSIETPFCLYTMERLGERNIVSPEGNSVTRPVCIGMNNSVPKRFVNAANIGLIDKISDEADAEAKKKTTKIA